MSMLKKFLNVSAAISGLIAVNLIATSFAEAGPKRDGIGSIVGKVGRQAAATNNRKSQTVIRSNNRNRSIINSSRGYSSVRNRNSSGIGSVVGNVGRRASTYNNRRSQTVIRNNNRRGYSAAANRNSNGIGSVVGNVGRSAAAYKNNNRTVITNGNRNSRGFDGIVRNVGRKAYRVRNGGAAVPRNFDDRPVAIKKRRGYGGYRYGYNRYRGGSFIPSYYAGGLSYSIYNSHNYYDNYYGSHYSVSYGNGYGYPYYGYGPSWGWGTNYYSRPRTRVVYVERPVETVVIAAPTYVQQPPQRVYNQKQQFENESCLQVREYTTTIEIAGENVPAYGNACLMPDGSWKFGDPIAEPSY